MGAVSRLSDRFQGWLFAPVPAGRIAVLRTLIYLYIVVDILYVTSWAREKADVSDDLYQPLRVARVLPIFPEPSTPVVEVVFWALLILAPIAATGRAPRALGWTIFALYFEWMLIAMSYGKVDHDRFAILVALAVLPTVGAARHGDDRTSAKAGWALRVTQLAVVATYFLAAWAKLRFGGIEWLWGTTLTWAIIRRGTIFSNWMLDVPVLLKASQVAIVLFELTSPIIFFVSERVRRWIVAYFYGFHVAVSLAITITFAPHLVAMTSFLPLERLRPVEWVRRRFRPDRPIAAPAEV
jgi:hypothetical protein